MKLPVINPNQNITIDLETCDYELKHTSPGFISGVGFVAGIAIAAEEGSWYIPIRHAKGDNYDEQEVVRWLNKVLSANTEKEFHNAQYDLGWLKWLGVTVKGRIFDTMIAAPLLDENRYSYSLDSLGKDYLGEGKREEALKLSVVAEFQDVKTYKRRIRLRQECYGYQPYQEALERVCPLFDLMPECVQEHYDVLGFVTSKTGQERYKVPSTADAIKGLMWAVDPAEMGSYPKQDVDLTRKLAALFRKELIKQDLYVPNYVWGETTKEWTSETPPVANLEMELVPVLLEMRTHGVKVDVQKAIELDKKYTKVLNKCAKELQKLSGKKVFEPTINADLIELFEKYDLPIAYTDKDNVSFSEENLPKDHPVGDALREFRKYTKARDTYVRGYIFGKSLGGRLHGQYNQLKADDGGTITGRLSASNPNLQNLPNPQKDSGERQIGKEIRSLFLPDDGDIWLCADYSGQEPRMLVHTALQIAALFGDRYMPGVELARTEEFRGRKSDFHTAVATFCRRADFLMQHKPTDTPEFKQAIKEFRYSAKKIGLGTMYGSGPAKIAEGMKKDGVEITVEEAKHVREQVFEHVPFLKACMDFFMNRAKSKGYILTVLKRRGRFAHYECPVFDKEQRKELKGKTYFTNRQDAIDFYNKNRLKYDKLGRPQIAGTYKALNKRIQGSSADQTKVAMVHLYKRNQLEINSLDVFYRNCQFQPPKMIVQVHDEINVSLRRNEKAQWYQDIMENCLPLYVETVAEPGLGPNWAEAK